jgi:hypothetical protein
MKMLFRFALLCATFIAGQAQAQFSPGCGSGFCSMNAGGASPVAPFVTSQRIVLNNTFVDFTYDYQFINHIHVDGRGIGPVDTWWKTPGNSPQWSSAILDSSGWPNAVGVSGRVFGAHVLIPASTDYATYVITWTGQGQLSLTVGTWTTNSITGTGCVTNSNGNWTGQDCRVEVTYSGAKVQVGWRVLQTNQSGGGYFRDLKFFRAADEADLLAGKIFRTPYKQIIADMNPSAIRFMNWTGGNDSTQNRFENRNVPGYATYGGGNPTISPPYQETSTANLMTVPAATGMPVAMQHGELAMMRIGVGEVRAGNRTVTAIQKCNPAVLCLGGQVTATAHGFNTGDTVVFVVSAGMTQLDHWNTVITVVDADHFDTTVDTTGFTTFTAGTVSEYMSLDVGVRGAYPVISTDASTPIPAVGSNNFMVAGDYRTFYFDKKIAASRDGAGALIYGAWLTTPFQNGGTPDNSPPLLGTPLEICTALVNEVNALSDGPISMWITIPHWGLSSMDPDYSAASNFPVNAVKTVLNGANGYLGLTSRAGVKLFVENTNERWNPGASFKQTYYYRRAGFLAYGGSQTDTSSYSAVRSVIAVTDIKTAVPAQLDRLKFVQAIQGGGGFGGGSPNKNYIEGTASYFADPNILALPNPTNTPISYHDYMAFASYFDPPDALDYMTKVGAGGFTDDSALYAGTAPYGAPNQALAVTNFVNQVISGTNGQSINLYTSFLTTYATAMQAIGKEVIQYEGGHDWAVAIGGTQGGHVITAADQTFLLAAQGSADWAAALISFFGNFPTTTAAAMPAAYVMIDQRFGYTSINSTVAAPDNYSGGIEGAALSAVWTAFGTYDAGLP